MFVSQRINGRHATSHFPFHWHLIEHAGWDIATGIYCVCGHSDSGTHVRIPGTCTHRHLKGLYIKRHNKAVALAGQAIMEGVEGGCLTALVIDAGWHRKLSKALKVTELADFDQIPEQVLTGVPEASLSSICELTCCSLSKRQVKLMH